MVVLGDNTINRGFLCVSGESGVKCFVSFVDDWHWWWTFDDQSSTINGWWSTSQSGGSM